MHQPERPNTPIPFSMDEATLIRQALRSQASRIPCPRCDGDLTVSRPIAGGGTIPPVREVRCESCRASVIV